MSERRILWTCETDFLRIAKERWVAGITFAPIVFWPQQQRPLKHVVSQVIHVATIRQDLLASDADASCWAERLAKVLEAALSL